MSRRFAVIIVTHGRADNVVTYRKLREHGYDGQILLLIDDEDKDEQRYRELYGEQVRVFSKEDIAKRFDLQDNLQDRRAVVYARNAVWDIAKAEGLTHFAVFDDDYGLFKYRFNSRYKRAYVRAGDSIKVLHLDMVLDAMCDFLDDTNLITVAMAQGGDFIGGESETRLDGETGEVRGRNKSNTITFMRKVMNSFVCRTDRRFWFTGRINEDVNMYVLQAVQGKMMGTTNQVALDQGVTQQNDGGLTDIYKSLGTYVKSFYSVMVHPSGVQVRMLNSKHGRIHHAVDWNLTAPKLVSEAYRKPFSNDNQAAQS